MQGSDGALYGAAAYGGDDDFGTLFRLLPTPNGAPTAVAGEDQSIHAGTPVELNGSASFDDDTPRFPHYAWSFSSRPSGSTATLSNASTAMPTFTADRPGTYLVQLIVTDEDGLSSAADIVEISSPIRAPRRSLPRILPRFYGRAGHLRRLQQHRSGKRRAHLCLDVDACPAQKRRPPSRMRTTPTRLSCRTFPATTK